MVEVDPAKVQKSESFLPRVRNGLIQEGKPYCIRYHQSARTRATCPSYAFSQAFSRKMPRPGKLCNTTAWRLAGAPSLAYVACWRRRRTSTPSARAWTTGFGLTWAACCSLARRGRWEQGRCTGLNASFHAAAILMHVTHRAASWFAGRNRTSRATGTGQRQPLRTGAWVAWSLLEMCSRSRRKVSYVA